MIRIRKLCVRYRLPAAMNAGRLRLGSILSTVLDSGLEHAANHAGLLSREEICIRRIACAVQLSWTDTDQTLVRAWSECLSGAIRLASEHREPADPSKTPPLEMVRFPSRSQALVDLAVSVALGDFQRAWAWRQLGFWRGHDTPSPAAAANEAAFALTREPALIVPVLRTVAERRRLPSLAALWREDHWLALAAAAYAAAAPLYDLRAGLTQAPHPAGGAPLQLAQRLASQSIVLSNFSCAQLTAKAQWAVAALVLAEVEPALARQSKERVTEILGGLQWVAAHSGHERKPDELAPNPPSWTVFKGRANDKRGPNLAAPRQISTLPGESRSRTTAMETATLAGAFPCQASTDFGGLLFLIRVVDSLELPITLLETLPQRSLGWSLHQLAVRLTGAEFNDAAALAFAGLPPNATPPDVGEPPPSDEDRRHLDWACDQIQHQLVEKLGHLGLAPNALRIFVCQRGAKIVADVGLLEASFSLDTVSTELRRVALDLDPGYVPWLGISVKFIYE